jgi:hypothetical protein
MAVATITLTKTAVRPLPAAVQFEGTVAISADPDTYATGGLVVPWANKGGSTKPPIPGTVRFAGKSGYTYEYDDANTKLMIRTDLTANPSAEIAAAAIPAGVSGDTIKVVAQFPKFG